jgi:hypothetical protein
MKKSILVLLALLAFVPLASAMAQTPAVAVPPAQSATVTDAATAQFLATLSTAPSPAPNGLTPAPSFMTGCTSSAQCPTGQLCCNLCGNSPDGVSCRGCTTPIRGHCPLIP